MKPGINQNISEADYHAFEAVSKSTLWKFAKNPAKWHRERGHAFEQTPAMVWGSLVDATLLQPEEIDKCFAVSPYAEFRSAE
jgi:hypothetical protein